MKWVCWQWLWIVAGLGPLSAYQESFSTLVQDVYKTYHCRDGDWADQLKGTIERIESLYHRSVSYEELQREGVEEEELDAMALEYCKKYPDAYVVTIWPTIGYEYEGQVLDILKQHCTEVVYHKKFTLKNGGPLAYMRSIPEKVPHIPKDFYCYFEPGKKEYPMMCFIVRANGLADVVAAKKHFRKIVKLDPYCMHINDTQEQGLILARQILNNNSIHFLNHHKVATMETFTTLVPKYRRFIKRHRIPLEDICVDGSCVMSAYGIRDCAVDFDFICTKYGPFKNLWPLDHHNSAWDVLGLSINDVLYNPRCFFYYDDLKFISLPVLKMFKERQGRPKDHTDVQLIQKIL